MMVGLQGAGKTTTSAKLAAFVKKQGKKVLLVSCDIYRSAAIKQLEILRNQLAVTVYSTTDTVNTVNIAENAVEYAKLNLFDVVIIDTAGRLQIDENLMNELINIKNSVKPHEILLILDSMIGQEAVNVPSTFNNKLNIDGFILTKLDGDMRGGVALSITSVINKPIKFVGMGEKTNALEPFYPERIASRILGKGDMFSLIEKAQEAFDEKKQLRCKKIIKNNFILQDLLDKVDQMSKKGSVIQVIEMMPGINSKNVSNMNSDKNELTLKHYRSIIYAMTKKERENPSIINISRKKRIVSGSSTTIQEVNQLLKYFNEMQKCLKWYHKKVKVIA